MDIGMRDERFRKSFIRYSDDRRFIEDSYGIDLSTHWEPRRLPGPNPNLDARLAGGKLSSEFLNGLKSIEQRLFADAKNPPWRAYVSPEFASRLQASGNSLADLAAHGLLYRKDFNDPESPFQEIRYLHRLTLAEAETIASEGVTRKSGLRMIEDVFEMVQAELDRLAMANGALYQIDEVKKAVVSPRPNSP